MEFGIRYDHEGSDQALRGFGETAPNPAFEIVSFQTVLLSLRYGLTRHINILASIPYQSIRSDKVQGASYSRLNRGWGDLLVTGEYRIGTSPQLTLEAGLKFPTGNIDKTDEFGQRICDILALGSGTTDPVVGVGVWIPHFIMHGLDVNAGVRHRFAVGKNKWGYQYGDQTVFSVHGSRPFADHTRLGIRFEGFHAEPDTWYDNQVPERGATMIWASPTFSINVSEGLALGGYVRFPVWMQLEGAQMVSPVAVGLELNVDATPVIKALVPGGGEE